MASSDLYKQTVLAWIRQELADTRQKLTLIQNSTPITPSKLRQATILETSIGRLLACQKDLEGYQGLGSFWIKGEKVQKQWGDILGRYLWQDLENFLDPECYHCGSTRSLNFGHHQQENGVQVQYIVQICKACLHSSVYEVGHGVVTHIYFTDGERE